jgi:hypothetical protein
MAAPAHTALGTQASPKLRTGFSSRMAFSLLPTFSVFVKEITPPDFDGGDPVENTTMENIAVHTNAPRVLVKVGQIKMTVEYALEAFTEIWSIINKEGSGTLYFPDGSYFDMFGNIQKFTPGGLSEGGEPTAELIWNNTCYDPTNKVEQKPVYTPHTGTGINP